VSFEALSQTVDNTISAVKNAVPTEESLKNPVRAVMNVTGAISSVATLPLELANTGIALATNAISAVLPSFPAATLGSLYVGIPHAHAHPPSLVPPAPPVPLPSLGSVLLGTCVKVLIGGMPAARCGDLGLAPTCGGIVPFFGIAFGSSKVFIGGTRAARMGMDFCTACTKDDSAVMRSLTMAAVKAAAVSALVAAAPGMVADGIDAAAAAAEGDAAMAGAKALSAAMQAAQAAADAAAAVASASMGTDPGIPPAMPGTIVMGVPNVLVAGLPLPNTPDPAKWLWNKIKGFLKKKKAGGEHGAEAGGGGGCSG